MKDNKIPVVIISGGIGNIIVEFLQMQECYFDNIYIIANFIEFENNTIKSLVGEVIHGMNKNIAELSEEIKQKLQKREHILLFGDVISDLKMIDREDINKSVTVGFLDHNIDENLKYFNREFDIVITNQGSFEELNHVLNMEE